MSPSSELQQNTALSTSSEQQHQQQHLPPGRFTAAPDRVSSAAHHPAMAAVHSSSGTIEDDKAEESVAISSTALLTARQAVGQCLPGQPSAMTMTSASLLAQSTSTATTTRTTTNSTLSRSSTFTSCTSCTSTSHSPSAKCNLQEVNPNCDSSSSSSFPFSPPPSIFPPSLRIHSQHDHAQTLPPIPANVVGVCRRRQQQQPNEYRLASSRSPHCHRPTVHWQHFGSLPLLISILISFSATNVSSLSSIRISAPDYIFFGNSMWLNCTADLDYNQIYSIKWFKDNQEMYRFITSDETPTTFYPTSGIVIDETRSNFGNLYILKTDFKVDADFRCEVLAENDFNTAIEIKKIKVYSIPKDGQPIILGKKFKFQPNELVNLTCSSPMSMPSARLMVTLNGNSITANSNFYQKTYITQYDNGQTTTSVNVQFPSQWLSANRKNDFHCTSSIIHRYNRTANVRFDARNDADNRTAYYLEEHISNQENNYIRPQFTRDRLEPRIENAKKKYEMGEVVSLRCISAQYKPMPELYWLVDGVPVDAQFLDYKQGDYHQNGFVRLDLKYRLGHAGGSSAPLIGRKSSSAALFNHHRTVESYNFKCVQVLSDVISVSTEVAQLWTSTFGEMRGNVIDGSSERNSEAVKSYIGNGAQSTYARLTYVLYAITFAFLMAAAHQHQLSQ